MASIRRALYQNGGPPFASPSPSQKLFPNTKFSSPFAGGVRRFFAGVFLQKYWRRGHRTWKVSIYRCLLLFLLGFLLGLSPFGEVSDMNTHDFEAFDKKPLGVNVREDDNAVIASSKKPLEVNVREDDNAGIASRPKSFVVDRVELTVERRLNLRERFDFVHRKQLIVITPTFNRGLQAYYLNRLGQVLRLVPPPLVWIVVEMSSASMETAEILRKSGVMYRHLVCAKNSTDVKDRGVHQRNVALEHVERHRLDGIVYFADDDNIYSLELFESMRQISRFGTWPVAMLAQGKSKATLEGPVCNGSQVIGWNTNEKSKRLRRFHVDMSGFAFNSTILWDSKRWQRHTSAPIRQLDSVKEGFQETTFIEQVVEDETQMEGIPPGCSRIMNWHLHLETPKLVYPRGWLLQKNLDVMIPIK